MDKKKNQHYVPQFYLKNFSVSGNQKTINLFNPKNELFVQGAAIKNQSSKDYFYGKDGRIEEGLSQIENILAPKIADLTNSDKLPRKFSDDHFAILIFMILNDLRNPTSIDQIKSFTRLANEQIEFFSEGKSIDTIPEISHDFAMELSFSNYEEILKICLDLDYKLLINRTDRGLLTCDFPSIKYNQFLEKKNMYGSITGYSTLGLQLFLPINPNKCILFYDPEIYKVGNKKDKTIYLSSDDVDQLNILQILNCWKNAYFNEQVDESYIKDLYKRCKRFKKANISRATSHKVIKNDEILKNEQIIHFRSTDLRINLQLNHVKFTRKANSFNLEGGVPPSRKKANLIVKNKRERNG